MVLWATLALVASLRGLGSGRAWLDGVLLGGLWVSVVMAFSRTGWLGLLLALAIAAWATRGHRPRRRLARTLGAAVLSSVVLLTGLVRHRCPRGRRGASAPVRLPLPPGLGLPCLAHRALRELTGVRGPIRPVGTKGRRLARVLAVVPRQPGHRCRSWGGLGDQLGRPRAAQPLPRAWLRNWPGRASPPLSSLVATIVVSGGGVVGGVALATSFLPAHDSDVLFEPSWWFAAGLYLAGGLGKIGLRTTGTGRVALGVRGNTPTIAG